MKEEQRRLQEEDLQTMTPGPLGQSLLNEAMRDKACNKLDTAEARRKRGFQIRQHTRTIVGGGCDAILCLPGSVLQDRPGFSRWMPYIQPLVTLRGRRSSSYCCPRSPKGSISCTSRGRVALTPPPSPTTPTTPTLLTPPACLLRSLHNAGINFPKPI